MPSERACLVVSSDLFNSRFNLATVVPITHYQGGKEDTMGNWGVAIYPPLHVNLDPANATKYPIGEQLWENRKSIIDCSQLCTVSSVPQVGQNHVRPDRLHG